MEDQEATVGTWHADIQEFNVEEGRPFEIRLHVATHFEGARELVRDQHIDAAIVDLRVPDHAGGPPSQQAGNDTLKSLLETMPGPIAVFSGLPGEANEIVADTPIKVCPKEAGRQYEILDWLCDHADLMSALTEALRDIRRETSRVFVSLIWRRWERVQQQHLDGEVLRQIVRRQIAAHIAEQLSVNSAPAYHAYEFYWDPPLRGRLHTGDLLSLNDQVFVILTPQCDMVREYPDQILLAQCDLIPRWPEMRVEERTRYARQNLAQSAHFLPPCGVRGPWIVNFKFLRTLGGADAEAIVRSRFASITPQFMPHLTQRFSAFIGRVGQPELDTVTLAPPPPAGPAAPAALR